MARVFQYVRPVNAVLTCVNLEDTSSSTENGIRIKEEPPDLDNDDLNPLSNGVVETIEKTLNDVECQRWVEADNKNGKPKQRRRSSRSRLYGARRKRKRVPDSDSNLQESQQKKQKLNTSVALHTQNNQVEEDADPSNEQTQKIADPLDEQTQKIVDPNVSSNEQSQKIAYPLDEQAQRMAKYGNTCDVCFMSFLSEKGLFIHKTRYRNVILCEICNKPFSTILQIKRHTLTHTSTVKQDKRLRLGCYLCKRTFSQNTRLQMHLFHCHGDLLHGRQKNGTKEVITDFDKFEAALRAVVAMKADACADTDNSERNAFLAKIQEFEKFVGNIRLEDVIRSNDRLNDDIYLNGGENDTNSTKDTKEIEDQTRLKELTVRETNDGQKLEENLHRKNAEISAKSLKENRIKTEKVDESEEGLAGSDQIQKRTPGCPSTPASQKSSDNKVPTINSPFTRMHMNPGVIINMLNDRVKVEPTDSYGSPTVQSSSYNLRKPKQEPWPSPFESLNASPSTRSGSTLSPKPRLAKLPLEERLKIKYKCKQCSVRLMRCDNTSKRVLLTLFGPNYVSVLLPAIANTFKYSI